MVMRVLRRARNFGPAFSNQVWSTDWLAIFCPRVRLVLGARRWIMEGKNPRRLEK